MVVSERLTWVILLGIIPFLAFRSYPILLLWIVGCALIWVLDVLFAPSPKKLIFTRENQRVTREDQEVEVTLLMSNPFTRKVRGEVRDAWDASARAYDPRHSFTLSPHERGKFTTTLKPRRRGNCYSDHVAVRLWGPLHLGARQRNFKVPGLVRVLPRFNSRKRLPSHLRQLREMDGSTLLLQRGQGTEFDSLREYVIGDDIRDIDWHASARFPTPVVKTWRPERDRSVMICLDLSRLSAMRIGEYPRVEAEIEAALLLAALADQAGDRVHFLAFDNSIRALVSGVRGAALLHSMGEAIAPLECTLTEANWELLRKTVTKHLAQRSLVVLCSAIEPSILNSTLLDAAGALASRHNVVIAGASDPEIEEMTESYETLQDIYRSGAAEASLADKELAGNLLRLAGVRVVEALPEQLPEQLANTYLQLKKTGRI